MNLILIGPPGSGKGSQAQLLTKEFGLVYFSAGVVLREFVKQGTPLAQTVAEIMNKKGKLIPDSLMMKIMDNHLAKKDLNKGIVFDGFPRNLAQAKVLDEWLLKQGLKIDKAIYLAISAQESIKRLGARWVCPKCRANFNVLSKLPKEEGTCDECETALIRRIDDQPKAILSAIAVFEEQTVPVIEFYEKGGVLAKIDGEWPIEVVFTNILRTIKQE